ncbi:hypothetical protein Csa_015612, partial [Cucumis sativus]
ISVGNRVEEGPWRSHSGGPPVDGMTESLEVSSAWGVGWGGNRRTIVVTSPRDCNPEKRIRLDKEMATEINANATS